MKGEKRNKSSNSKAKNIGFSSNNICKKKLFTAAKNAEILEEIKSFKNGFKTIIGERGVKLSGGQRQRLAIARTFYKNPEIYIFDDCLSAIDAVKEKKILKNLASIREGKTSIIISHRIATIKNANHIIVMDKGEIIERGTHQHLLNEKGFYSQINNSQNNSN